MTPSALKSLLPEIALAPVAGLLLLLNHAFAASLMAGLSLALLLLRRIHPATHRHLQYGLQALARGVAALLSLLVLALTYFLVLTPLALLLRASGRDVLATKLKAGSQHSEWHKAEARRYDDDFFKTQF